MAGGTLPGLSAMVSFTVSTVDALRLPRVAPTVVGPPINPEAVKRPVASMVPMSATSMVHWGETGEPPSSPLNWSVVPGPVTSSVGSCGEMVSPVRELSPPKLCPESPKVAPSPMPESAPGCVNVLLLALLPQPAPSAATPRRETKSADQDHRGSMAPRLLHSRRIMLDPPRRKGRRCDER